MTIFIMINADKSIVQIHNNKDVKLFSKDLINISLKAYWYVH